MLSGEITKFSFVKIFFIEFTLVATPVFISSHSGKACAVQQKQCNDGFQTDLGEITYYGKSSISIFQQFFGGIGKIFIVGVRLGARL